jgi:hypothetical protein
MSEVSYPDHFRFESGDAVELSSALSHELQRLAAAGIKPDDIDYKPELHYVEVRYQLTLPHARALGYSEAEIGVLIPEAC